MDLAAELTLHVLRFVQQPVDPPMSPARWTLLPEGRTATWPEARALLAGAVKPLMVSPLAEQGLIGSWGIRALTGEHLARVEHNLQNQAEAFEYSARQLGLTDDDQVLLETFADEIAVPVPEMRRYFSEYAVIVPWSMHAGPDAARRGRLLLLRPDRTWSPGMSCRIGD